MAPEASTNGRSSASRAQWVLTALAAVLLAGCAATSPTVPRQAALVDVSGTFAVRVVSPRLVRFEGIVPPRHYFGYVRGAFIGCSAPPRNLTPSQMARHPQTVELLHGRRVVAAVHLVARSGFQFLVVGPRFVKARPRLWALDSYSPWSPRFLLRTTSGFRSVVSFGGLPGVFGVSLDVAPRSCPGTPRRS